MRSVTFTKGELSPRLFGRYDLEAYYQGLGKCRNWLPVPQGAIIKRPGLQWMFDIPLASIPGDEANDPRIFPFVFNESNAYLLIFGDQKMWVAKEGVLIESGGSPLEVVTPYAFADLADIRIESQVGDVATVTHPDYAPRELTRVSETNWTLTTISFASGVSAPTSVSAVLVSSTTGVRRTEHHYVVTAVDDGEESVASSSGSVAADFGQGEKIRVEWDGSSPPDLWNIYKARSAALAAANPHSTYGYIGSSDDDSVNASTAQFGDDFITPDFSQSPPSYLAPFGAADDYPRHSAFFQDRRWFANTNNLPFGYWATATGLYSRFVERVFPVASDAIIEELRSQRVSDIRWMVPLGQANLVIGTGSGVFVLQPREGSALSPGGNRVNQETYRGSARIYPVLVENSILYVEQNFRSVRDLLYDDSVVGYRGDNLSIFSEHLLQSSDIRAWCWTKSPYSTVYMAMEDGTFRTMTYDRGHRVVAWATHDTPSSTRWDTGDLPRPEDKVRDVVALPEGGEDRVYAVVRRSFGAETSLLRSTKITVERFHTLINTDRRIDVFSDCASVYDGRNNTDDPAGPDDLQLSSGGDPGDEVTMTSLGSIVTFSSDDIGNRYRLLYPTGRQPPILSGPDTRQDEVYEVEIIAYTSPTEVTVRLLDTVPSSRAGTFGIGATGFEDWEYAKKRFEGGGLDFLINREVHVLADGFAVTNIIVQRDDSTTPDTGYIELQNHAATVVVGVPYESEAHTMPLLGGQTKTPEISSAIARVHLDTQESRGLSMGVVGGEEHEVRQEQVFSDVYSDSPPYYSGILREIIPPPSFDPAPQLLVASRYPVRAAVVGIHIEFERSR